MHRIAFAVSLLVGLFSTTSAFAAEPLVVDLWPGKTPGDVGIKGEETSRIHQSPLVGPTKLITNVTKPTLTIYRPAADKNTGTAMLICPGGGYWDLYWELEGEEVAAWLNSVGMTGIILKYRCPRRPGEVKGEPPLGPQLDAQRAVSLVRSRAAEWGIDPKRIGMVGFSAGGHLALATATGFAKRLYEPIDAVDKVSCRPDFAVLCYSGYLKAKDKDEIRPGLHIPADTPPIFLAHASDDKRELRRLRRGEQRVHVPGLEARRHPDRAARLRDGRPRLRRAAEREAPVELDAALRQLAAQPGFVEAEFPQIIGSVTVGDTLRSRAHIHY